MEAANAGQSAASTTTNALGGAGNVATEAGKASFDAGSTAVGQSTNMNAFKTANPFDALASKPAADSLLGSIETSGMPAPAMATTASPGVMGTLAGYGNDIQNWAKANPLLAKAALDGTSAFVKGAMPSEQEKQMMAYYKAQTEAQQRKARWGSGRV
jgi:hypothetical protein